MRRTNQHNAIICADLEILWWGLRRHLLSASHHKCHKQETDALEDLKTIVRKWKMKWHENVMKANNLSLDIFQDKIFGKRKKTSRKGKKHWQCHCVNLKIFCKVWDIVMQILLILNYNSVENNHLRIQAVFLVPLMVDQFLFNSFFVSFSLHGEGTLF